MKTMTFCRCTDQLSDRTWSSLIQIALKYSAKIGNFNNRRYERSALYVVIGCRHLSMILVENGVIGRWQAGFRRLSHIEALAIAKFRRIHGVYHTDP